MAPQKIAQKTAVVYCRTSTKGQKDAETIEAQVSTCKTFVESHDVKLLGYGPKGDGWLTDDGITGSLLEGRAFANLIDDLEHSRVKLDYLIVSNMNRLSRPDKDAKMEKAVQSAMDSARIYAVLRAAGVKIIDKDGINEPGSIITDIKQSISADQFANIRSNTMAGKARVLGNGAWATGGRVPYGYQRTFINGRDKKQGTTLAPHHVDGPRFRTLMRRFVEGGQSHAARFAQAEGWPAPRGGTIWYPSTVEQILKNIRAYLGETTLTINGQPFDITYPELIDARTFAAIERRKKERTLKQRTTLLGTGFVDCACGRHIHGHRSGKAGPYYTVCRGRCGTMREALFAAKLWEMAVARVVQIKEHEEIINGGEDAYGPQLDTARAQLARIQEQIARVVGLFAEGTIDKAALTTANETLRAQKVTLQADVDRLHRERDTRARRKANVESVQSRVQSVLKRLRAGRVPLDGRRQVLADLLQGERVTLTWRKAKVPYATIMLPAFGMLPPIAVRIDRDVTTQIHGISREVLDIYYQTDDVIEDIAL
jgi:DNA invertase Pin-like site-specific DNA recombinase